MGGKWVRVFGGLQNICQKMLDKNRARMYSMSMELNLPVTRADLEPQPRVDMRYPRNRDIMLRFLEGQEPSEIADYYGLGIETIRNILSSPLIQQELLSITSKADEKLRDRIARLGTEAVDMVRDTLRGKNTNELKLKAAKELLDRNPEFDKKIDSATEAAAGLGEAIIRELARRAAGNPEKAIEAISE
jgi:hypothetical protein